MSPRLPCMSMNGISSAGMTPEGAHHVVVFVLEDVTVVHVAAAEDLEADDDVDDFLRVDADGVLEAAFVVVEPVWDAVVEVVADAHGGAGADGGDPVVGLLDCGRGVGRGPQVGRHGTYPVRDVDSGLLANTHCPAMKPWLVAFRPVLSHHGRHGRREVVQLA
jgi:hypothetical protein